MAHDARGWRPQTFGRRRARDVRDPVIEPGWEGARVLVHVRPPDPVRVVDIEGADLADSCVAIVAALGDAITADSAVFDGYLTYQATARAWAMLPGEADTQTLGRHFSRLVLGGMADRLRDARPEKVGRIRGGIVGENLLIRKSMFIREPVNSYLLTWRTAGFRELAYKDPNSRYRPGADNDGWALAPMPRR